MLVVVHVEGGVVHSVECDTNEKLSVLVLDEDTDGLEDYSLLRWSKDGPQCYPKLYTPEVDLDLRYKLTDALLGKWDRS